jgi:hypothetical protein
MKNSLNLLLTKFAMYSFAAVLLVGGTLHSQASLLAHWKFDEETGTTASDSKGTFHGTLSSGASFVPGGVSGNALQLQRSQNGYVNMGNVLGLMTGDFTIVAWIKMNSGDRSDSSIFIGKHTSGYRNGYFLNVNKTAGVLVDDKAAFFQGSGAPAMSTNDTPVSATSVNDGLWHQVVAVYRAGSDKCIYVDGAPAERCRPAQPMVSTAAPLLIGGIAFGGVPGGLFTGLIDEVQIYGRALTDAEISFLYENPSAIALECADVLAQAQQTIATLQEQLGEAESTIAWLLAQNLAIEQDAAVTHSALNTLVLHMRSIFRDPAFVIPGATDSERITNLSAALTEMNSGQLKVLYKKLGGMR